MSANERSEALVADLYEIRLQLLHRIARLGAHRSTAPLTNLLAPRARAIERELELETALSVDEVRTEAMIDAAAELSDLEAMGRLAESTGYLRAERVRLEARLCAERAAVKKTQLLLDLRLRLAGVAAKSTRELPSPRSIVRPRLARDLD